MHRDIWPRHGGWPYDLPEKLEEFDAIDGWRLLVLESRPARRTPPPEGVHVRIGAAQERREARVSGEDPRAGVRALQSQPGAGGRCARTRQAQTVAERLRREGARVHEDARLDVGPARPLANLRHVMCECAGTPGRTRRLEGIIVALDAAIKAVPQGSGAAYHQGV